MKKLVLSVAVLGLSATMSFVNAQGIHSKAGEIPFAVEFNRLSSYLALEPSQLDEVYNIQEYFIEQQEKSLSKDANRQAAKMQTAVFGNLKLMKQALSEEQYRKYVTILNVTNNNNRLTGSSIMDEVYLAENN